MKVLTSLFCEKCDEFKDVVIGYLETDKDKSVKCAYTCQCCKFQTVIDYKPPESKSPQ